MNNHFFYTARQITWRCLQLVESTNPEILFLPKNLRKNLTMLFLRSKSHSSIQFNYKNVYKTLFWNYHVRPNHHFFFLMGKKKYIKKAPQSTQEVYKGCLRMPKKRKRGTKNNTPSNRIQQIHKINNGRRTENYIHLSPSPNITKERKFKPLDRTPLIIKSPPISFLPSSPKKTRATRHIFFFLFLPTKEPYHPNEVTLTEKGSTHDTPKRENNKC